MRQKVFINGRFLGQRMTGVQRYALETLLAVDELLSDLGDSGELEITVLAPPGVSPPKLRAIGFKTVGPLKGHAWEQLVLPVAARGGWLWSFGATGPLLKRRQTVTIHDAAVYAMPRAFSREFRAWYRVLLPLLARRTPLLMTVSRFSRGELERHLGVQASRVRVSGEGWQHVQRLERDEGVLSRNGLTPGHYALAVSSHTPQKNFELIAKAVPLLAESGIPVAVAGRVEPRVFGGSDQSSLAALKLLGYVSDGELRALYENAGVFVYPSRYEGFGIPPLEAMALGCPVLASNAASIPEVCGGAARYFDPDDAAGLAALMREVMLDLDERKRLVALGRARLAAHSWEAAARCHLDALGEVTRAQVARPVSAVTRVLAAAANR